MTRIEEAVDSTVKSFVWSFLSDVLEAITRNAKDGGNHAIEVALIERWAEATCRPFGIDTKKDAELRAQIVTQVGERFAQMANQRLAHDRLMVEVIYDDVQGLVIFDPISL